MSNTRSLRITNPELDIWVDEHIETGKLNQIMNDLLQDYRTRTEQEYIIEQTEEKIDRRLTVFNGIVLISIALFFFAFAISRLYQSDLIQYLCTALLLLSGILICFYVLITKIPNKTTTTTGEK